MIAWPSCCLRLNTAETQPRQIKLIDKDINRPNRIILPQIVIQPFRKQRALTAVIPNDKARHRILPSNHRRIISFESVFAQAGPNPDIARSISTPLVWPWQGLRKPRLFGFGMSNAVRLGP
jgi:hypothetical protein